MQQSRGTIWSAGAYSRFFITKRSFLKAAARCRTPHFFATAIVMSFLLCGAAFAGALFPVNTPGGQWRQFKAAGFSKPVTGIVFTEPGGIRPVCGIPLGSFDTGCIDLETSGLWGYSTIFNSLTPRGGPINLPMLGISVGGKTWVMTSCHTKKWGNNIVEAPFDTIKLQEHWGVTAPAPELKLQGVELPTKISYWGHYPVADMEFETTAPVSVGMRAWSSFLPGDVKSSIIPAAVFEVNLRNTTRKAQKGTVVFSFPGPNEVEAGTKEFKRSSVTGALTGVAVRAERSSYALGVVGAEKTRTGKGLDADSAAWAGIAKNLPKAESSDAGSSVAVEFNLGPKAEKVVRYVLAWSAPQWPGDGDWLGRYNWIGYPDRPKGGNVYTHMYAKYYPDAVSAAQFVARNHALLLKRVLAWQQAVYTDKSMPGWLQDVLVNNFHLLAEVGIWAQAKSPIGSWCKLEDGFFGMNESPRACPDIECPPCTYYGGMAVLYAFPDLVRSTLRGYMNIAQDDGCVPLVQGGGNYELICPQRMHQKGQNGSWALGVAARYWRRMGDDKFLREIYPYLKKTSQYIFNANPAKPYGLISLPEWDQQESFESTLFYGMSSHVGSVRLYHYKMMETIATKLGDTEYAKQCRDMYDEAKKLMDEQLWAGNYYIQHKDLKTGVEADVVMAYQLDGEFMSRFDGLGPDLFPPDKVKTALATIKKVSMGEWGPRVWSDPKGGAPDPKMFPTGYWTPHGSHIPSGLMLSALYMYEGEKDFGLEMARKMMFNLVCRQGRGWDLPILIRSDTGEPLWGNDYGQMMAVWKLPAALKGTDLTGPCKPGGLMDRIIRAANPKTAENGK